MEALALWEAAKSVVSGPCLKGERVNELLDRADARQSESEVEAEVALWVLSFANVRTHRRREVVTRLLRVAADKSRSPEVRGQALEGVGNRLEFSKQASLKRLVSEQMIALLRDGSPEVRYWAAFGLGTLRSRRARRELARLSADTSTVGSTTVGAEALAALARINATSQADPHV